MLKERAWKFSIYEHSFIRGVTRWDSVREGLNRMQWVRSLGAVRAMICFSSFSFLGIRERSSCLDGRRCGVDRTLTVKVSGLL